MKFSVLLHLGTLAADVVRKVVCNQYFKYMSVAVEIAISTYIGDALSATTKLFKVVVDVGGLCASCKLYSSSYIIWIHIDMFDALYSRCRDGIWWNDKDSNRLTTYHYMSCATLRLPTRIFSNIRSIHSTWKTTPAPDGFECTSVTSASEADADSLHRRGSDAVVPTGFDALEARADTVSCLGDLVKTRNWAARVEVKTLATKKARFQKVSSQDLAESAMENGRPCFESIKSTRLQQSY